MTMVKRIAIAFLMAAHSLALFAQAPSEHWKTVATKHFRFHYPAQYEAWTMRAASRIESIRDAVIGEVGFELNDVTDVIVMNPIADANGVTIPLLGHPRLVLFTEPPEPEMGTGEFGDWIDLLDIHEVTHLIHLTRPSRNPLARLAEHIVSLNRITLGAPRWVLEGYATVVEGRLTGQGRPNSAIRASILRKWAASGRLPSYSALASNRSFLGMSMAYLAGSAYLEWLEARSGPDSLRHLWARMTARQKRDFDAAFIGVFGDSPEKLYGRFTAELTQKSVITDAHEGELWMETKWATGEPAVSPDGKEIALVERDDKGESKIVVYSTGPNEEEKKLDERIAKMLKRDPQDVAPVRTKPLPRKPKRTIQPLEGGDVSSPRWAGSKILYTHKQPDRDGFLHNDLFLDGRRVTHLADVKDADGNIAVRNRNGFSQLVRVNLETGEVTDYTPPALDRIYSHPRVSGGGRVAWAEHDVTGWHVVVDGQRRFDGFEPEWGSDGSLYYVVAHGDFIDIMRDGVPVTHSSGAAFQPAPAADGLYFMSLEPTGYELRRCMECGGLPLARAESREQRAEIKTSTLGPARDYGIGRQERGFMFGGHWTAFDRSNELGVRLGDVVGRLDTILIGATGPDRGLALASAWRGWPVTIAAHAWRKGVEVRAEREFYGPGFTTYLAAGTSSRAFATGAIALHQRHTGESLRVSADSKHHVIATARARATFGEIDVALQAEAGKRLTLGGFASSVVPQSYRVERVDEPALANMSVFADRYRSARLGVGTDVAQLFWQRYDVGRTIDVRGLELSFSAPPIALVKTAGLDFTLGAARVSGSRGVKGWIGLRWRP